MESNKKINGEYKKKFEELLTDHSKQEKIAK